MKRTLKSLLVLSTLAGSLTAVQASAAANESTSGSGVKFQLNNHMITVGSKQVHVSTAPYIRNGNFVVPVRELADGIGASVTWNSQTRTIQLSKGNHIVQLKNSSLTDGKKKINLAVPVTVISGKVYVPLRAVTDAFGAQLSWNSKTNAAVVTTSSVAASPVTVSYSFGKDTQGWSGGFADLPVQYEKSDYQLEYKWSKLPNIDNKSLNGLLLKGMNRSDDLFMFATRKVGALEGLKPNTTYQVKLSFQLATNEASDSFGIGGSPAASIFVKAGVVNFEPKAVKVPDNQHSSSYQMNLDKGNQGTDGKDMTFVGDAAKPDPSKEGFQLKPMQLDTIVKTGANGEAYLIIGTDSGYEGLSTFYLTNIQAVFSPAK